ncbi:hypothetical protein N7491_001745 [Penicillium cf. griseofulvum]|uniref:Uncharacterized protein n=1 Tax=Penicillium cf. griseofulvum TaxID=2972120 RepID=A0A9W9MBN8_9EURO|nr:hypothetical protein N7472_006873 [Penicillium cf. griseofulvum]KAJ5445663.1 hypothetical protein N7491_001745 [Penicillium cf. griseofulvum]
MPHHGTTHRVTRTRRALTISTIATRCPSRTTQPTNDPLLMRLVPLSSTQLINNPLPKLSIQSQTHTYPYWRNKLPFVDHRTQTRSRHSGPSTKSKLNSSQKSSKLQSEPTSLVTFSHTFMLLHDTTLSPEETCYLRPMSLDG